MDDKGIDGARVLANHRQAMLGGSSYVPKTTRSRRVVTQRRSSGGRRYY